MKKKIKKGKKCINHFKFVYNFHRLNVTIMGQWVP